MGKLTVEQKMREHDRGQKASREGRPRSWSEPWAYPFESDEHYARVYLAISSVITVKPASLRAPNEVDCAHHSTRRRQKRAFVPPLPPRYAARLAIAVRSRVDLRTNG
jgi:hypothetical protein